MLKKIDELTAERMVKAIKKYGNNYLAMRKVRDLLELTPETIVPRKYFSVALAFAKTLYAVTDKGATGKHSEAVKRVKRSAASWLYFREFFAHKQGKNDINKGKNSAVNVECKSSVGDFLHSEKNFTVDDIITEYRAKKNQVIEWEVKQTLKTNSKRNGENFHFCIVCAWPDLFDYLESYNGNINTWIKAITFSGKGATVSFQEINTSAKKIDFLCACPYNKVK